MKKLLKGLKAETELISIFSQSGFCVIRAAGSGSGWESPDCLVFKKGIQYAFECKSIKSTSLSIPVSTYLKLRKWETMSGITTMIAWRIPRVGFRFAHLEELRRTVNYSISKRRIIAISRCIEDLL